MNRILLTEETLLAKPVHLQCSQATYHRKAGGYILIM
jgi:hypothetical protein